jgi:hypothetical protein
MDFILFAFAVIGLTNILIEGSIFEPLRCVLRKYLPTKVYSVFECPMCMGVWCGWFCGLPYAHNVWQLLLCGFAGSCLANSYGHIAMWIPAHTST